MSKSLVFALLVAVFSAAPLCAQAHKFAGTQSLPASSSPHAAQRPAPRPRPASADPAVTEHPIIPAPSATPPAAPAGNAVTMSEATTPVALADSLASDKGFDETKEMDINGDE